MSALLGVVVGIVTTLYLAPRGVGLVACLLASAGISILAVLLLEGFGAMLRAML